MSRRSRHGSHSRWLLEQVQWEVKQHATESERTFGLHVLRDLWDQHPFIWSGVVQICAFLLAWLAGAVTILPSMPMFDVADPSAVIATAWQVLAGFVAIAFAGLAVLMQLTSEPVVTSRSVRQVLFQESQFRPVLAFAITAVIQVGAATLFLNQSESAVIEVAVVAVAVLWTGWSYARVGKVYANPGEALRLGEEALVRDLRASMWDAHARGTAEARLHAVVPREWRWTSTAAVDGMVLLTAERGGTLTDVDIDLLRDITKNIAGSDASAFKASAAVNAPKESSPGEAPELRIMTAIGSTLQPGQEIYVLKNSEYYNGDVANLRKRLTNTLRWREELS